jgi:hypothetical protein
VKLSWRSLRQRGSWPAAAGAAALAAAAWLQVVTLPGLRGEVLAAQAAFGQALHRADALRANRTRVTAPAEAERFRALFAPAAERHQRAAALLALARVHDLDTRRVEMRWSVAEPLSRYQLTTPVEGRYENIRAFIAQALQQDPSLSLDALQLRRTAVSAGVLQADLRWSLQLRNDASSGRPASRGSL